MKIVHKVPDEYKLRDLNPGDVFEIPDPDADDCCLTFMKVYKVNSDANVVNLDNGEVATLSLDRIVKVPFKSVMFIE